MFVKNVCFQIPEENASTVAARLDEVLTEVETKGDGLLRMIFSVTPTPGMIRNFRVKEFKKAIEPFRSRVRYVCVENVIVVSNPLARTATRAALCVLRPDVPTRVVQSYFA
jgi:hypothetical protein